MTASLALHSESALDTFRSGHSLNPSMDPSSDLSISDITMDCDEGRLSLSEGAHRPARQS